MKKLICAACFVSALWLGVASADPSDKGLHASGTIVSVHPPAPEEAKSLVVKTDSGEVKYVVSEAAIVTPGLKPGDVATVDYIDSDGIHWADTVKKVTGNEGGGKKKTP